MRKTATVMAGFILMVLPACHKGVTGTYRCTGMPDITALTLDSDGTYTSRGSILDHATTGSGKYKADATRVILQGSYTVAGLTRAEPTTIIFDREKNGDLKSLLTACKK